MMILKPETIDLDKKELLDRYNDLLDALIQSYEFVTVELAFEHGSPTKELVELATLQEEILEKAGCDIRVRYYR